MSKINNLDVEAELRTMNEGLEKTPKVSPIGFLFWFLCYLLIFPIIIRIVIGNKIRMANMKVKESMALIDVYLKKRHDTLIKLIDSVKNNINFEQATYAMIVNLRMGNGVRELARSDKLITKTIKDVGIQLENYPNLKTSDLVKELMNTIAKLEDDISNARRVYNSNVSWYNQYITIWPHNVVALVMRQKTKIFYEIIEEDRNDVEVKF